MLFHASKWVFALPFIMLAGCPDSEHGQAIDDAAVPVDSAVDVGTDLHEASYSDWEFMEDYGAPPDTEAPIDVGPDVIAPMLRCDYPASFSPEVAHAVDTGALGELAATDLLGDAVAYMDSARTHYDADLRVVLGLDAAGQPLANAVGPVTWDPTHDGALLTPDFEASVSLLGANQHADGPREAPASLAVLGRVGEGRFLAFGGNPFRNTRNDAMDRLLRNAIAWLTSRPEGPGPIVLAHLAQSYYFPDEVKTREYLTAEYTTTYTTNAANACDGAALVGCLAADPALMIISQDYDPEVDDVDAIVAATAAALARGVAVIYLQYDGGINPLGERLLRVLGARHTADNYWPKWRLEGADPVATIGAFFPSFAAIHRTLSHLRDADYAFDLQAVAADPEAHEAYQTEFLRGAEATRQLLKSFDTQARDPFAECGQNLAKLLVLIGDALRSEITYPMSAASTEVNTFLRAHFADHAVFISRSIAPAQPDRGNFDPLDHTDVVPKTFEQQMISRPNFRATGAYLLPGQTATIIRLDTNDVTTHVFVNTLYDGATHIWDAYNRPNFLQSQRIPIRPGESRTLTSPYGGPIQIAFDSSDVPVSFVFQGVGTHPFWDDPSDDADFAAKLASREYHWVEVASDGFEVHSRRDLFDETLKDPRWSIPAVLAEVMQTYTFSASHVLAGFRGRGLIEHPEVHGWADARGLPIRTIDVVKHGNMDQARCGYGCSGNPYDAYWSFDPLSHGDLHELGHGLQRDILQFQHAALRYENHAATNWTPFYVASLYFDDHGGAVADWTIDPQAIFTALQAAYTAGERPGTFSAATDTFLAQRIADGGAIRDAYAFLIQAMASAVHAGALDNGYHLIARIHLLDDATKAALSDGGADAWTAGRTKVGMADLSQSDALALTVNDRLLLFLCEATRLDYTDYFDLWGLAISAPARAQAVAHGYPTVPRAFFIIAGNAHKEGALSSRFQEVQRVVLDGVTPWPAP